jgi:pumilio RNA-binding family
LTASRAQAVEFILPDQQSTFVRELELHIMRCVKDSNGNHVITFSVSPRGRPLTFHSPQVIQKLIERVASDRLDFINVFYGNVFELATHPYGCRVLQRCFEHLPDERTRPLLDELHKYITSLMQDQYGVGGSSLAGCAARADARSQNYVVQFVLEHGHPHDRDLVVQQLRGKMILMARHKFASNVCEKALVTARAEDRVQLIDEMLQRRPPDGTTPVALMMKDQFASAYNTRTLLSLAAALTTVDRLRSSAGTTRCGG